MKNNLNTEESVKMFAMINNLGVSVGDKHLVYLDEVIAKDLVYLTDIPLENVVKYIDYLKHIKILQIYNGKPVKLFGQVFHENDNLYTLLHPLYRKDPMFKESTTFLKNIMQNYTEELHYKYQKIYNDKRIDLEFKHRTSTL